MLTLRPYQQEAVNAVWEHLRTRDDNPCIVCLTGAGKSLILAELCRQAVKQWRGRVLIVTHVKELIEQNTEKIRIMLDNDLIGVHSAGLNKHDIEHQVIVAGIQSIYNKARKMGKFDLVIIDECFPAGTLIDTPRGEIPIEDLYVGQPVRHALGVGNIEAISSRPTTEIVRLELSNGKTIECTPNHRFFTESGWCVASALAMGSRLYSYEDVSSLRKILSPEYMEGHKRDSSNLSIRKGMERSNSHGKEGSQNGQTHQHLSGEIRVVNITYIKLESPRVVYNLQVAEHPSYYANGALVHNCHLIPPIGEGAYRTFIDKAKIINPRMRIIGLTATPFRMTSGEICSKDNILNHICYEIGVKELIEAGYLSPLISKAGIQKADISNLHIRCGEFAAEETENLMNADALVKSAVGEIIAATQDRKACIIFCAGVKHGLHVVDVFRKEYGLECGFIDGNTLSGERARTIARFKGEQKSNLFDSPDPPLKYLANVSVLCTGFDAPHIDCVALLRPTMSPGLFYQQCGRGFRLAPGKENCLILDFANNITRHGPIDMLRTGDRPKSNMTSGGEAPARECPECHRVCHASIKICPECGYEFPFIDTPKHDAHASTADVISSEVDGEPREFDVLQTTYTVHYKRNAPLDHPPTLRVNHRVGGHDNWISEYVCPEHSGYARDKFESWWSKRCQLPPPKTVDKAVRLAHEGCLAITKTIRVKTDENGYDRIIAWSIDNKPELDDVIIQGEREIAGEPEYAAKSDSIYHNINPDDIPF